MPVKSRKECDIVASSMNFVALSCNQRLHKNCFLEELLKVIFFAYLVSFGSYVVLGEHAVEDIERT